MKSKEVSRIDDGGGGPQLRTPKHDLECSVIAALTNRNMIDKYLGDHTTRFMPIVWADSALDTFQTSSMTVQGYPRSSFDRIDSYNGHNRFAIHRARHAAWWTRGHIIRIESEATLGFVRVSLRRVIWAVSIAQATKPFDPSNLQRLYPYPKHGMPTGKSSSHW